MCLPSRKFAQANSGYRYGFNGKEKDNETKGEGNAYDYGFRIQDPRLGRWLSVDPLQKKYTDLSPYQYCANSPIQAKDPDGRLIIFINGLWGSTVGIAKPLEPYWNSFSSTWIKDVQAQIGDMKPPRFFDGSAGGFNAFNHFKETQIFGNNNPDNRVYAGKDAGYKNAEAIIGSLDKGETIKLVTNSMGSAFERGFTDGILQYQKEENDRRSAFNASVDVNILLLNVQKGNIENDSKHPLSPGQSLTKEQQSTAIANLNSKINELKSSKKELLNVRIEMNIDLSSHQIDYPDKNAEKSFYMLAPLNNLEKGFVDQRAIKAPARQIGLNPDGSSQMSCHFSPCAPPQAMPECDAKIK